MPPSKAAVIARTERRRRVAAMWLRRTAVLDIATTLNVTRRTVSRDIEWIKEEWRRSNAADLADAVERERIELDKMENDIAQIHFLAMAQYNAALRESRLDGGSPLDAARPWLGVAQSSLSERLSIKQRRARLLGLDAALKQDISGEVDGDVTFTLALADDAIRDDEEAEQLIC